jgi:hypothetical protein
MGRESYQEAMTKLSAFGGVIHDNVFGRSKLTTLFVPSLFPRIASLQEWAAMFVSLMSRLETE